MGYVRGSNRTHRDQKGKIHVVALFIGRGGRERSTEAARFLTAGRGVESGQKKGKFSELGVGWGLNFEARFEGGDLVLGGTWERRSLGEIE